MARRQMMQMYHGIVNSPIGEIMVDIAIDDDVIPVSTLAFFPPPPNQATLGLGLEAETVRYNGWDEDTHSLIKVERGFQGTAKAWANGSPIARIYTEYDQRAFIYNMGLRGAGGGADTITIPKVPYHEPIDFFEEIPIILGRAGITALPINDEEVLLVGGVNRGNRIDGVLMRLNLRDGRRQNLSPMPVPRSNAGIAWNGEELVVIGGRDRGGNVSNAVEMYTLRTNAWSKLQSLSVPLEGCQALLHGNDLYCIGGTTGQGRPVDNNEVMNLHFGVWSAISPMVIPRSAFGAKMIGSVALCMGGDNASGSMKAFDRFSVRTRSWGSFMDMPQRRSDFNIQEASGFQIAIGTRNGLTLNYKAPVDKFSPKDPKVTGAQAAGATTRTGAYSIGGRLPTGEIEAPMMVFRPGRIQVSPVEIDDVVYALQEIYTATQRIKPQEQTIINDDGMLYTDTDLEYGWIKKGGF